MWRMALVFFVLLASDWFCLMMRDFGRLALPHVTKYCLAIETEGHPDFGLSQWCQSVEGHMKLSATGRNLQ